MNSRISLGFRKSSGFTLIELMVSMVLMAIVMSLATMALSQFNGYADKSGKGFEARINGYLNLEQLKELINRTSDYYVKNNNGNNVLFYQGNEREIRFVSTTGWREEQDTLNILRVESDKLDNTLEALVLYQRPLSQDVFFEVNQFPSQDSLQGIILIDGAKRIAFDYLGIENIRQLYPSGTTENFNSNLRWLGDYDGNAVGYLPSKVRMQVDWPDNNSWPAIFEVKAFNLAKRGLMLGGAR
ncbi:type IV pilin protein [Alteromonas sp. a30]|uniref:type IV pilin protein n=1 Tax=Alteromonas sp. a30 TaxID=2730917 RepID=UPI002280DE35|nr:prepilin-type N-terminal cleavage/methylation domain-containing protein [Alteromonas sp. a30]MCY7294377.1 prepilin-type N-terminal cleavage/methylation domain-containing protein [Alteromonas sp. a30]